MGKAQIIEHPNISPVIYSTGDKQFVDKISLINTRKGEIHIITKAMINGMLKGKLDHRSTYICEAILTYMKTHLTESVAILWTED